MWFLYQIATALTLVVAGPFLLLSRGSHYLKTLPGRMGHYSGTVPEKPLWIHAVSVGEVGVAAILARELPPGVPLLVTTITPTGQDRARSLFENRATVTYLPFDLAPVVEGFLDRFSPRALILVEGDLWPLLLARAKRRHLPIAVVNGRVSDRSFRRMARLRRMLGPLLGPTDRFGMQSTTDRQRLVDLGVDPQRIEVTGNLKFETSPQEPDDGLVLSLREVAAGRPILIAGSTMAEEEQQVLQAFVQAGSGRRSLLMLAPRHPERWNEVAALVRKTGLSLTRRSTLDEGGKDSDVLLLDSLGELSSLYQIGLGCFIGGSLVPTGGHNPLEPAQYGVPVSIGPSMENFREIAAEFSRADAWAQVENAAELARVWRSWLDDPGAAADLGSRGLSVVKENQGSLERTMAFLKPLLGEAP
jgi:3-deoxy-D-manno-octulosonic-acid transferase